LPAALLLILWLKKIPMGWRRRSATVPVAPAGVPPTESVPFLWLVVPFVAMGAGMGLVTMWWERFHQGTQGNLFRMGLVERVLVASRALWFYLGKLLWPANLTFSYPHWTISASDPWAYGWLAATVILGLVIWRTRRKTGRGVEVAAVFFAATLSPLLGFIMVYTFAYSFVADHYQYLACLGPIALAAAAMETGWSRGAWWKTFLRSASYIVLLLVLGLLTWRQCGMYADAETLWHATLARNPDSWLAHNNLGTLLRQKGQVDEAIYHYQQALKIMPDTESVRFNLARAFVQEGKSGEAIAQYHQALQLDPNDMEALNNLAWLLATAPQPALRNGDEALQLARRANELAGGKNPVVMGTLAAAFAETGQFAAAAQTVQQALELAQTAGQQDLIRGFAAQLQRYKEGRPLHQ
jgi:tetratricopeptide (TPR) repeat protein